MGYKESNMYDQYVQAFFALFALGSMAFYLALGGMLVEWWINRKRK
jgi:hypothetical protein